MCYNLETSLTSFVMSWGIAFYLLKRNIKWDRWMAIFLLVFSINQFFDFLLWSDYAKTQFKYISNLNILVSCYLLPIFLSLQFLTQLWGKYYFETKNIRDAFNKLFRFDNPVNLIYFIFSIVFFTSYFFGSSPTTLSQQGHLLWSGVKKTPQNISNFYIPILFLLFVIYPMLGYFNSSLFIRIMVVFAIVSLSWSFFCTDSWGSLWCWIGNFSSLIMLFGPYLD